MAIYVFFLKLILKPFNNQRLGLTRTIDAVICSITLRDLKVRGEARKRLIVLNSDIGRHLGPWPLAPRADPLVPPLPTLSRGAEAKRGQ